MKFQTGGKVVRVFAISIAICALINCTYTLPYYNEFERENLLVISERVGETIDAQERSQFDLLRGVENFKSARFFEISGDGYDVEIFTEDHKLIGFNRDPDAVLILRDYIERYEVIKDSMPEFEKKWGIIDYDTLGQPITRREVNVNMNPKRHWRGLLALSGGTIGCVGSCLIFGAPIPRVDVPTDYDNSEDIRKSLINLGATTFGGVSGWFIGKEIDKRKALEKIKDARRPRLIEL
jgi:hypothetical protein